MALPEAGTPLREISALFLKLGATAFGGPAAHIAMMDDEVVARRRWLTREQFLDYAGAVNLIPGPNSTELACHIGHRLAGWPGLAVAGVSFILPAFLIVFALGWVYTRFGSLPDATAVLYGIKPVVIAVVLQALWSLGRVALKSPWLAALAVAAAAAAAVGVHELAVLAVAGLVAALPPAVGRARTLVATVTASAALTATVAATAPATAATGLWQMFLVFAKAGSMLFGSGYVLLAFLRADLVERLGWLTEARLIDAIAVGQVTPGPVFTTATFIGYVLAGTPGAIVATAGIFLPAFFFVAISGPLVPRIRRSPVAGAALDGVNVASLALMAVVTWQLGRAALVDLPAWLVAAGSVIALMKWRVNSAWLVAAGAAVGWIASRS